MSERADSFDHPVEQHGSQGLSAQERSPMQGFSMNDSAPPIASTDILTVPDDLFIDYKRHDTTLHTYPSGDSAYIRAYGHARTPELTEHATLSFVGKANLRLQRDDQGWVERAFLQDIEISNTDYRGIGISSHLLETGELYSKNAHAKEIYGVFPRILAKKTL